MHQHRQAGDVLPVMRNDVRVDRANKIFRAGQVVFLVPGQIAEIGDAEFSEGNHHAHGLFILSADEGVFISSFGNEIRAIRIRRLPRPAAVWK